MLPFIPRISTGPKASTLLLSMRTTGLDLQTQCVTLDSRVDLHYDRLLLATGAVPRRLDIPSAELDGVYFLGMVADADAIRHAKILPLTPW